MQRLPALTLTTIIPGSMAIMSGSLVTGVLLLSATVMTLSVIIIGLVINTAPWLTASLAGSVFYCLLSLLSATCWWRDHRTFSVDAATVRRLHEAAAGAFLRKDFPTALLAARQLVRHATAEAGAWRLMELVARHAGDQRYAHTAMKRALQIEAGT